MTGGRFLIVGAGIGGLSAALALARVGASVTIIEQAAELKEIGAGVQMSPNATRILAEMGLLDRLIRISQEPMGIRVRDGRSARQLSWMPLDQARDRWGAPFLVVHRAGLQAILAEAAAGMQDIAVHLNTRLAGFGSTEETVRATARQGQITRTFDCDALIGADGIHSAVRARVVAGDDPPQETGRTAWRTRIPVDGLDPMFRALETGLWLGRDAHLVLYPLDGASYLNVVAITKASPGQAMDGWSGPGDVASIRARFSGWNGAVRDLIEAAPSWSTWPLYDRRPLGAWHVGRIALLGDAAHPILPFLAQGSAQAIEDAAALANVFAAENNVPKALAAYSRRRMPRVLRVQRASRELGRIYHLSGARNAARNLGMRLLGGERLLSRYDWLYSG